MFSWISACTSADQAGEEDDLQISGDGNSQSNSNTTGEEGEEIAESNPIGDDGYDDDWNNMGTQQQQKQQAVANTNQNTPANNEELGQQNLGLGQGLNQQEAVQEEPVNEQQFAQEYQEAPLQQQADLAPVINDYQSNNAEEVVIEEPQSLRRNSHSFRRRRLLTC